MVLKCLPTDFLLVTKEKKNNHVVEKSGQILSGAHNEHHQRGTEKHCVH